MPRESPLRKVYVESMSPSSGSKRPASTTGGKPKAGVAEPGAPMKPAYVPDESDEAQMDKPRSAPAPGVPMSEQQYERLKERARVSRTPPSKHRQEDPARKR